MKSNNSTYVEVVLHYGDDDDAPPIGYEMYGNDVELSEILRELCESPNATIDRRSRAWKKIPFDPDRPPAVA